MHGLLRKANLRADPGPQPRPAGPEPEPQCLSAVRKGYKAPGLSKRWPLGPAQPPRPHPLGWKCACAFEFARAQGGSSVICAPRPGSEVKFSFLIVPALCGQAGREETQEEA